MVPRGVWRDHRWGNGLEHMSMGVLRRRRGVDNRRVRTQADSCAGDSAAQVEYFGYRLRVKSPHLAALLNGGDAVQVLPRVPDEASSEGVTEAGEAGQARQSVNERRDGVVIKWRRPAAGP
jgi:hypothetical protein